MINLRVYFEDVETTKEHKGYFYSVTDAIVVVILGCMCGLKNTRLIHQWATDSRGKEALKHDFGVHPVPSYYWLLCLLTLVKPDSLNRCFLDWVTSLVPGGLSGLTVSLDGNTIRSTGKADTRKNPLHIVSAQVSELGLTLEQRAVDEKSNEIPAVQELLKKSCRGHWKSAVRRSL